MTKQVKAKVVTLKTLEKGTPYRQLMSNRLAFSALTIAALCVTGYTKLNKQSVTQAKTKGDAKKFKRLVGDSAWKTWKRRMNKEHDALAVPGMNEIDARLAGESAFSTDMITVTEFVTAMKKGGTVKVGDQTFDFCIEVN